VVDISNGPDYACEHGVSFDENCAGCEDYGYCQQCGASQTSADAENHACTQCGKKWPEVEVKC